jgi:LmbE family N-acetylglucosaminyl deacetylase
MALALFCGAAWAAEGIGSVRGKTVIVVQAHPDDAESRCAGTVALLQKNGNKIIYVVATRDDKGTYDIHANPDTHAALRKREEEAAVKVLQVDVLEWLGYDDGWLDMVPRDKLRGDIVRMLRKYKPDILFAFDPRNEDEHMDHRASAFAAMDAVTAAPFPLYFPDHIRKEKLSPHQVSQIYYYDTLEPNVWVDIQETIEIKIDALAKHVSQKGADRDKIAADMKLKAQRDGAARGMSFAESLRAADLYVGVTPSNAPKLRIGLSRTEITPPIGHIMGGYGARKGVSTGIHDPLTATVAYLEKGSENIALVALDLRSFPSERVLKRAKEELGVRHVLLAASHTHSGPITWEKQDWPTPEKPWFREAEDRILDAIAKARSGAFPGHIDAASGAAYIGQNRRLVKPDGTVTMLWRNQERVPTHPLDPTLRVLRLTDAAGKTRAVGVNYACHGVNLGPDNLELSADWPGYMRREMEQELGAEVLCFFFQGAPGDINPYLDKQPVSENGFGAAQESGHVIAAEALRVLKRMRSPAAGEESIEVVENLFEVPDRWDSSKQIPIGTSTIVLNKNIALVAVPGEAFVELQKSLTDQSPLANTFFVGYCYSAGGVWAGYLPTIAASAEGGYGAGYNTNVAVGTGEKVVRQALVNLYQTLDKLRDMPER